MNIIRKILLVYNSESFLLHLKLLYRHALSPSPGVDSKADIILLLLIQWTTLRKKLALRGNFKDDFLFPSMLIQLTCEDLLPCKLIVSGSIGWKAVSRCG